VPRVRWWELVLVASAALCAVAPLPPRLVEAWFSTGIYPAIQHAVTPLSNLVPIAVLDVLIVVALAALVVAIGRAVGAARRQRRIGPLLETTAHRVTAAAVVYLVFLVLWGFNYRRVRMRDRLAVEPGAPSRDAVLTLGLESVRQLNALHDPAHATGWHGNEWTDAGLRAAFARVQRMLSGAPPAEPGRLKATLLGPYFRWTSVDGMVDPFALEVLVNPDLLPFERPFVAAHEWGHLAGFADESEANFIGWLTCVHAGGTAQYSGWLYLYWQILGEVGAADRMQLTQAIDDGPRRDVDAIVQRLRRGQLPVLRNASWAVYDKYLRANRVEEGIRSYGEVVTLILRARFENGWAPVRRSDPGSSR
jgi:hypothetical protein